MKTILAADVLFQQYIIPHMHGCLELSNGSCPYPTKSPCCILLQKTIRCKRKLSYNGKSTLIHCRSLWTVELHAHWRWTLHIYRSQNFTFSTMNSCDILLWWLFVKDYGPTILYHPGKKNAIANIFSCIPCCNKLSLPVGENGPVVLINFTSLGLDITSNPDLLEWLLYHWLMSQKTILLTLSGYMHIKIQALNLLQKQINIQIATSTKPLKRATLYVILLQMITVTHNRKLNLYHWSNGIIPYYLTLDVNNLGWQ